MQGDRGPVSLSSTLFTQGSFESAISTRTVTLLCSALPVFHRPRKILVSLAFPY